MNHSHQLVTDLLSDDYQMLYKNGIAPFGISIFIDPEKNDQVWDAVVRIEDRAATWLKPAHIFREERRYMGFTDGSHLMLTPSTLVLVLFYHGESQRVLELTLSEKGAQLHFRKK